MGIRSNHCMGVMRHTLKCLTLLTRPSEVLEWLLIFLTTIPPENFLSMLFVEQWIGVFQCGYSSMALVHGTVFQRVLVSCVKKVFPCLDLCQQRCLFICLMPTYAITEKSLSLMECVALLVGLISEMDAGFRSIPIMLYRTCTLH